MLRVLKQKVNDNRVCEPAMMLSTSVINRRMPPRTVSYFVAETLSVGTSGTHIPDSIHNVTPSGSVSGSVSPTCGKHVQECDQPTRHHQVDQVPLMTTTDSTKSSPDIEDSPPIEKILADVVNYGESISNKESMAVSGAPVAPRTGKVETQNLPNGSSKVRKISMDGEGFPSRKPFAGPSPKRPRLESNGLSQESSGTIERAIATTERAMARPIAPTPSRMILLSSEQDEGVLSPLHVFVRKQVEVFIATASDLGQPAPGRKQPIQLHQVGLRCIHCRHLQSRKRVKRAVCFPSSVGRVYHSVSDMKFDHFPHCKALPEDVREKLLALRLEGTKEKKPKRRKFGCSSSTAQYYHDSALQMGMMDCPNGIFMSQVPSMNAPSSQVATSFVARQSASVVVSTPGAAQTSVPVQFQVATCGLRTPQQQFDLAVVNAAVLMHRHPSSLPGLLSALRGNMTTPTEADNANLAASDGTAAVNHKTLQSRLHSDIRFDCSTKKTSTERKVAVPKNELHNPQGPVPPAVYTMCEGAVRLSDAEDDQVLNPLHCFVRKHVEIFTADESDISAPAPGRKTRAVLGQVGVRCIHCAKLPIKERVKRAVCYPPSVSGLYHSISNMKFDHFAICRGLPSKEREEFAKLKSSCSRRSTVGTKSTASPSSTAQYYHDSAVRKGLEDTNAGIRFTGGTPGAKITGAVAALPRRQPHVHTGMSALMMAASQAP